MNVRIEDDGGEGCRLSLRVVPGASRPGLAGPLGDRLKIRVAAPPREGRANREVRAVLAEALGVPVRAVEIVRGHGSRDKEARVEGLAAVEARRRLGLPTVTPGASASPPAPRASDGSGSAS